MECSICCLEFTKSKRMKHKCQCEFEFCTECLKNDYKVKKETKEELICFECKAPFSQKFLKEVFSKFFFQKEILNHLTEAELEKEKRELQKAQSLATHDIALVNWKSLLEEQYAEQRKIKRTIDLLHSTRPQPPEFVEEVNEIKKKCPLEGCNGFVHRTNICESCNREVCKKCEEEFLWGHICNEDLLLTIKEKKRDSKPCPKCEIPISKINGCNQMWCPICNTVFDYVTGNIEKGYIHNPEYLANMRAGGNFIRRAEGDVRLCDDLTVYPVWVFTTHLFFRNFGLDSEFINLKENIHFKEEYSKEILEKLHNIRFTISDIQSFMNKLNSTENIKYKKRQLQADFINKKITEVKWKTHLKSFLKTEESNSELVEICTSFMRSLNDIISNCIEITRDMKNCSFDIFNEQLHVNVLEILTIHNDEIFKNRNEIGFVAYRFYPEYLI